MSAAILSFDVRWKHRVHIAQISLIVLAIILSIVRVTIKNPPATRANTIAVTMGLKSLVVIAYQMLTEHHRYFHKWASTKANAVLNCLECVFWLAVLVVSGISISGSGAAAAVSAITLILALVLEFLSIWMAGCSLKIRRQAKHGSKASDTKAYGVTDLSSPV